MQYYCLFSTQVLYEGHADAGKLLIKAAALKRENFHSRAAESLSHHFNSTATIFVKKNQFLLL